MLKLMRNRWLLRVLLAVGLIALGLGIYQVQPPAPMCVIDAGNLVPQCFAGDGKRLVTLPVTEANAANQGPLQIFDCRTGAEIGRHFEKDQMLTYPTFSRNGRRFGAETALLEPGENGRFIHTLHLVDLSTGTALDLSLDDTWTGQLRFTPAGDILTRLITTKEGRELQLYDGDTGRLIEKYVSKHLLLEPFTDDAVIFRLKDSDDPWDLEFWSVPERKSVATLPNVGRQHTSPDGQFTLCEGIAGKWRTGKWTVWSMKSKRIEAEFRADELWPHAAPVFSPDNRFLAVIVRDEKAVLVFEVRELPTGRRIASLPEHVAAAFSPDGRWLALDVLQPLTPLILVDVPTLEVRWRQEERGQAWSAFSADSESVFTISRDRAELVAHDCATGNVRARIPLGPAAKAPGMHLTPDRRTLLVQQGHGSPVESWFQRIPWLGRQLQRDSDCLVVLDTNTCRERFRLAGWGTRSALLSDDGATLVTTDIEQTRMMLRCWDVDAFKPPHWAIGVPAGLAALIALFAWWRGRRAAKTGGSPCSS